jgi:hypothetical protein
MSKPNSITVRELIEQLENFDPETQVLFAYNYGDYWRTEVAEEIREVEMISVEYSDYHQMQKIVDDEPKSEENVTNVVILR